MTTIKQITVNTEQELYVIPGDGGYSCLGFDVCIDRILRYVRWLQKHGQYHSDRLTACRSLKDFLPHMERGSIEAYNCHETLVGRISDYCLDKRIKAIQSHGHNHSMANFQCDADLTPELVGLEGKRVEVVDRYDETRRFWVGKSMGCIPIHLEVSRKNSMNGCGTSGSPFKKVTVIK